MPILKNKILRLLVCMACMPANTIAIVKTAPAPLEVQKGNAFIGASDQYKVEIWEGKNWIETFCYSMNAMTSTNNSKTTAWCSFTNDEPIKVRVTKLKDKITYSKVLPQSAHIDGIKTENTIEFTLPKNGQYSVEFEKGIYIEHPLLLFSNAPEQNVPNKTDKNVRYFDAGYHDVGTVKLKNDDHVYLADGAYVKGQFVSENCKNVRITGRGILSGEDYAARTGNHMISLTGSYIEIKGITIIHSPKYNIALRGSYHTIKNVKMMGWWFSTDGVSSGDHSLIEDCFFKCNDDAIKLYRSHTEARNCVIWQMENGAPFMLSWNMSTNESDFYAHDIEVIRVEHEWDNPNLAVFCAIHGGKGELSNYKFENIRIDNSSWRIVHLITQPNRWGSWDTHKGSLSDIVFKNIEIYGNQRIPSLIMGHDTAHKVTDVQFINVKLNGKSFQPLPTHIVIDKETTERITFNK